MENYIYLYYTYTYFIYFLIIIGSIYVYKKSNHKLWIYLGSLYVIRMVNVVILNVFVANLSEFNLVINGIMVWLLNYGIMYCYYMITCHLYNMKPVNKKWILLLFIAGGLSSILRNISYANLVYHGIMLGLNAYILLKAMLLEMKHKVSKHGILLVIYASTFIVNCITLLAGIFDQYHIKLLFQPYGYRSDVASLFVNGTIFIYLLVQFIRYYDHNQTSTMETNFLQLQKTYDLTTREMEVIKLVVDGLNNQEIADQLFLAVGTVKTHIYKIYQKTDVKQRVQLVNLVKSTISHK